MAAPELARAAEAFVKAHLAELGPDASHDWWHIHRVRNLALALAKEEGLPVGPGLRCRLDALALCGWRWADEGAVAGQESSLPPVELAALLHDVGDWKYTAGGQDERASVQVSSSCSAGLWTWKGVTA